MPSRNVCFSVIIALTPAIQACTHHSLERNTARAATTPMDIEYRMILDNLAQISVHPNTLPGQARIQEGTVQIGDDVGTGYYSGLDVSPEFGLGATQIGPVAHRTVTMEWGTDAITDPIDVHDLRNLFRRALGLPSLCDPQFLADARRDEAQKAADERKDSGGEAENGDEDDKGAPAPPLVVIRPGVEYDVPVGWFSLGGKKDVPKDACYVGRYKDRYVWVMADGVDGLADFTLAVLAIKKLDPADRGFRRGLTVTRGRAR